MSALSFSTYSILLVSFCLSLLSPAASQQCRLQAPAQALASPSPVSSASGSPTSTASSASPPQQSSSPNSTNSTNFTPFTYGTDKVRGVNLGGWFVLEPWITPSIFNDTNNEGVVDEFTLGQLLDASDVQNILQNHWKTWITQDDFAAIKAAGLTHVRIPFGYWSVPMNDSVSVAPFTPGAWPYLLQALNWARANDLHVILDLHGAPGSQNGYDNSGQRTNNYLWAVDQANVQRSIEIWTFVAQEIGGMVDVIELLNEPAGFNGTAFEDTTRQYFQDGYDAVRGVLGNNTQVMIGDAFLGVGAWENFLTWPSAVNVLMDLHNYQIFNDQQLGWTLDQHISGACANGPGWAAFDSTDLNTVIGEWSTAYTDCAPWLNGRGVGARWDGSIGAGSPVFGSCDGLTGNFSTFSEGYKTFMRQYWEAQVIVAEQSSGWIYWAWKTESTDEWSYQKGLEGGWIPQDPTDLMYPTICN